MKRRSFFFFFFLNRTKNKKGASNARVEKTIEGGPDRGDKWNISKGYVEIFLKMKGFSVLPLTASPLNSSAEHVYDVSVSTIRWNETADRVRVFFFSSRVFDVVRS